VIPARLTTPLVIAVATISRRSRWVCMSSRNRSRSGVGEVQLELLGQERVLGGVRAEQLVVQRQLAVGEENGELRRGEPPPAAARSAHAPALGRNSSVRLSRPLASSAPMNLAWTPTIDAA
jgi:hypothetical protein